MINIRLIVKGKMKCLRKDIRKQEEAMERAYGAESPFDFLYI